MSERGIMSLFKRLFSDGSDETQDTIEEQALDVKSSCVDLGAWPHTAINKNDNTAGVSYDLNIISLKSASISKDVINRIVEMFSEDLKECTMNAAALNMKWKSIYKKLESEAEKYTE